MKKQLYNQLEALYKQYVDPESFVCKVAFTDADIKKYLSKNKENPKEFLAIIDLRPPRKNH